MNVIKDDNIVSLDNLDLKDQELIWAAYFYPETYDPVNYTGTMKNLQGIRIANYLSIFEERSTQFRSSTVHNIKGEFDIEHFKSIHKHLFKDVYSWAGELRKVNMNKGKSNFVSYDNIEKNFNMLKVPIKALSHPEIKNNQKRFTEILCNIYLTINQIHAFREGNGRTQNEFIRQLAEYNGYKLDLQESMRKINKDEYYDWFDYYHETKDFSLILKNLFMKNIQPIKNEIKDKRDLFKQIAEKFKGQLNSKDKIENKTYYKGYKINYKP